jgi:uncharacterized protein
VFNRVRGSEARNASKLVLGFFFASGKRCGRGEGGAPLFDRRFTMTTAQVVQDNAALVKRGYDAFASGDMTSLQELYHAEATFYTVPHQTGAGTHLGRDAIFAFFVTLFTESKGTFRVKPTSIAAVDNRVFVLQDVSGERNGYSLQETSVMVFTIENGLVREMREFVTPASHIKDFWDA